MKNYQDMPYNKYMTFLGEEWEAFPGKLSASQQPGYFTGNYYKDQELLEMLKIGVTSEDIDQELLNALDEIYQSGVRIIVSLADVESCRNPELLKKLWEQKEDAHYVTKINDISTTIEDHRAPTQEQLEVIAGYVTTQIKQGENVLVHCGAGFGRTGTALAAIYMLAQKQYDPEECISYVKSTYDESAVENTAQKISIKDFSITAQKMEINRVLAQDVENTTIEEKNMALENATNLNMKKEGIQLLERGAAIREVLPMLSFERRENLRKWSEEIRISEREC